MRVRWLSPRPRLTDDKVVKKLPDMFTDVVVGGGGATWIFHLARLKKLAVFDLNKARVVKYIPLAEDDVTFTAGLDCIVIGLKQANRLERWSLTTFELENSSRPPFNETITGVLIGYASKGPLVVNGFFLDLATFRMLPILSDKGANSLWDQPWTGCIGRRDRVRCVEGDQSPVETSTFVNEGGVVKRYEGGELLMPSQDPTGGRYLPPREWRPAPSNAATGTTRRTGIASRHAGRLFPLALLRKRR